MDVSPKALSELKQASPDARLPGGPPPTPRGPSRPRPFQISLTKGSTLLPPFPQALTASLERKGVLAKVKAELRAHVFEAVQQKDGAGSNRKRSVSDLPRGALMASLVAEYLEWSLKDNMLRSSSKLDERQN